MSFFKISLVADSMLSLHEKKKYIDSMFGENLSFQKERKRNQGFAMKFNNSIGFKAVVSTADSNGVVTRPIVNSPDDYLAPHEAILNHIQTPLFSHSIIDFYIEDNVTEHPDVRFSYEGSTIATKWAAFLDKVFPSLTVATEQIEQIPVLSLKDFTLQYFYRNLDENAQYTLEFSAGVLLTESELEEITTILNELCTPKVTIAQYLCDTCSDYSNGEKPYHTEIVYLTNYSGVDEATSIYEEYGDAIYRLKEKNKK